MIGLAQGPTVMMTLGQFQFGVATAAYQELSRATEYKWAAQERFGTNPQLQFVGYGDDSITLPGVIYPEYRGGFGQVDEMRIWAAKKEPLVLVDGTGWVMGQWVIQRVEEKHSFFGAGGIPRKQEFTLSLRFFDEITEGQAQALNEAAAAAAAAASPADQAAAEAGAVDSLASAMASKAEKLAAGLSESLATVQGYASEIGSAVSSITTPVSRCYEVAMGLKNSAQDVRRVLSSSKSALAQADSLGKLLNASTSAVLNANLASTSLKRSIGDLSSLGGISAPAMGAARGAMISVNRLAVGATSLQATATKAFQGIST